MAAGLYLLLMWGYMILQTPQLFAAFSALIMSTALLYWGSDARALADQSEPHYDEHASEQVSCSSSSEDEPSLSASIDKLDELKEELNQQYAQFGKDQSQLNSNALGTWQRRRWE